VKLTIKTEEEYSRALRWLDDVWRRERSREGVSFEVLPYVPPATIPQVTKLRGLLYTFSLESGNEQAALKIHFENEHGPREDEIPIPMERYSKAQASAMIDTVIHVAGEQGIPLQ